MSDMKAHVLPYRQKIYDNLEKLVNINSFSSNIDGLRQLSDQLSGIAAEHGIALNKTVVADDPEQRPHLLYRNDRRDDYFAFIGHFDTVHPPGGGFELNKGDDTWVGPGVNDMKNGLLVAIYTLVVLKDLMPLEDIPLRILFNADEEISSPTSRYLIDSELKNARAGFVFESGRMPGDKIVTSRKGVVGLDVDIVGKLSHAGESPGSGVNAVVAAAKVVERLDALNDRFEGCSVQCTEISGGTARNVVPDLCRVGVDIRVLNPEVQARLFQEIESILNHFDEAEGKVSYQLDVKRPPFVKTDSSAKLIEEYIAVAAEHGFAIEETSSGGVSDANNLSSFGVPVIDGLGALGRYPHTHKEFMVKESLFDRLVIFADFFHRLIQKD